MSDELIALGITRIKTREILKHEILFQQHFSNISKHYVINKVFKLHYISGEVRQSNSFWWSVFFVFVRYISFIYSDKKIFWTRWDLKISFRGLQIDSPHVSSLQMLVASCLCTLFEPSSMIIFLISSDEKWTLKVLAVSKGECKGNVLPLTSSENTVLPNKYKKILLSSLKTTIKLLSYKIGVRQEIFDNDQ